ncbi:MAG: hypothetical protein HQ537_02385 [Parcubacteria group bacterium]|nr:hypothetical protein [Parcubacteria group bacterium]
MPQSKTKTCQNCKAKFIIEPEDFEFYKKIDVPEPTFCPECRMQRRMIFKNDFLLYKRREDFAGEEVFSTFSPEAPIKVYGRDYWWSDKWDALEYGQDYNFNKPFFKQIKKLIRRVPWPSQVLLNAVNSDYCMNSADLKNCYLMSSSGYSEDCAYSHRTNSTKDSYDNSYLSKCELCYQSFKLAGCYRAFYSKDCTDCQDIYFCNNCINCQNCFGCVNLRHKKYYIFNKLYTKEEYFKKVREFDIGSYNKILSLERETKEFWLKFPNKFMQGRKNVNVTGNNIYNSKNVFNSFIIQAGENLKYCQSLEVQPGGKDCYDYSFFGENAELVYETAAAGRTISNIKFCFNTYISCRDLEYCVQCENTSDCFGCVGLRHKQYCILNRQYTKEQYEELVPKIKKHMNEMPYLDKTGSIYKYGEFFPPECSTFSYNRSMAQDFFPLTKEQVLKKGYIWHDKPKADYKPTIKAKELPDHIKDADDSILKQVIQCSSSDCAGSRVFRLIPQELAFYKKTNLPLPRFCPDCRNKKRFKQIFPFKLWSRKCMCAGETSSNKLYKNTIEHKHKDKPCKNTFQTTYAPDRKEIVYCERCYNKEVG